MRCPCFYWYFGHFTLISMSDLVSLILRNIGQCDVNCIMTSSIKTITLVLNVLTYIIIKTIINHTEMLAMMSVSTFKLLVFYIYEYRYICIISYVRVLIWMLLIYLQLVSWQLADMFKVMWRWTDNSYSTVYDIPAW